MKKITFLFFVLMVFCGYSQTITVEAESGKRYRGASIQNCSNCSNLEQVGDIGGSTSESAYFTSTVTVATKGLYRMNLSFSSGDTRTIFISPNGATPVEVALNSGDWGTVGNQDIQLNLDAGKNTIKFYNYNGFAPNIDKFSLTLLLTDNPCTTCLGPFEAENGTVVAPASIQDCDTCSGGKQVGDMGYSDRYFTQNVTIATAGTYRVYVSYSTGATRSISITANETTTVSADCNSTDWDVVFVKALDINLAAGVNTLKFHNPNDWAPNIDRFRLELLNGVTDLVDLKVNGTTIGAFSTTTLNYNVNVPHGGSTPQITAARTTNSTASFVINNTPTSSTVVVRSANGLSTKTYTVNYTFLPITIEAESGVLYRGASIQNCSSCSNLQQVGDIGGNSVESAYFTSNITLPATGIYTMNLSFSSGDTRTIFISPNGGTPVEIALNSGGWGLVGTRSLQLQLQAGTNTIKFYNYNDYAPNIDRYTLVLTTASPCTTCLGPFEAESGTVFAPATVQDCSTCSGGKHVTDLGFSDRYFTQDVTIAVQGIYRAYVSYSSGSPRSISLTANDSNTVSALCNSTDWDVVFVKELDIALYPGNNKLKFHNPNDWAPNIDKFRLELIQPTFTYYVDADGDGFGTGPAIDLQTSTAPTGYSVNNQDCDDSRRTVFTGATELYNFIDDDCDGAVDEGAALPSTLTFCKGATVATARGTTDLQLFTALTVGSPIVSTTALASKVYYATLNGSARTAVTVTVISLPTQAIGAITSNTAGTTAGTFAAATLAVGPFVGTTTTVSYRVPAFTSSDAYFWTVPAGVRIVGQAVGTRTITQTGANGNVLNVNYNGIAAGAGSVGAITVQAQNSNGCNGTAKSITIAKALPLAPAAITMHDLSLPLPTSGIPTAVRSFAKYMGTTAVLRLTATPSVAATSYEWNLPEGVNQLSGGTSNVITVNFAGVTSANTDNFTTTTGISTNVLRIGVKAVNGVGVSTVSNSALINPTTSSTARLLTLTAVRPAAPALKMFDMAVSSTVAVTDISRYIGTNTPLALVGTVAATTLASSFSWELADGVNVVSGSVLSSSTIIVNFEDVAPGTASLYVGIKAVNGMGASVKSNSTAVPATSSTATLLKLSAGLPSAAGAVVGSLAICSNRASSVTYTITAAAGKTNLYIITAPVGTTITGGSGNTRTINAVAGATFTVNYPNGFTSVRPTQRSISIQSVNGFGGSAPKLLTLTSNTCTTTAKTAKVAPIAQEFKVRAYPNPSSTVFNLAIESASKAATTIQVYNMQGRMIENKQVNTNEVELGSNYTSGMYNVILENAGQTKTVRLIKK
jgi:hypothetical protein